MVANKASPLPHKQRNSHPFSNSDISGISTTEAAAGHRNHLSVRRHVLDAVVNTGVRTTADILESAIDICREYDEEEDMIIDEPTRDYCGFEKQ